jgi:hypothetical protein
MGTRVEDQLPNCSRLDEFYLIMAFLSVYNLALFNSVALTEHKPCPFGKPYDASDGDFLRKGAWACLHSCSLMPRRGHSACKRSPPFG